MSYTPTTWTTGDIITTTKLNNIESGVQSVNNSYTPTTWATGDIITAEKLNKIEQGIANAGGGGSWTVLTEESVTTIQGGGNFSQGNLTYSQLINADTIRVTFNGMEYECTLESSGDGYSAYGGFSQGHPDFTEYPFALYSEDANNEVYTETAGTYSIKIEAPQSSGSSDFSLAKMSIAVDGTGASNVAAVQVSNICTNISSAPDSTNYYKADKGFAIVYNNPDPYLNILIGDGATTFGISDEVIAVNMQQQPLTISNIAFSGDAEIQTESDYSWVEIMGDCTMTITIS